MANPRELPLACANEQPRQLGSGRYAAPMLRTLRSPGGGPAFRTRVVALLLALGMLLAAAPLLIPATRWAVGSVVPRRAPARA